MLRGSGRGERLVDPSRSHIANERCQVRTDFALNVKVPLQHVITMRLGFNRRVLENLGTQLCKRAARERDGKPVGPLGRHGADFEKRGCSPRQTSELIKQRKGIINSEARAHGRLSAAVRIPGETYPGLEVSQRRVEEQWAAKMGGGVGEAVQI